MSVAVGLASGTMWAAASAVAATLTMGNRTGGRMERVCRLSTAANSNPIPTVRMRLPLSNKEVRHGIVLFVFMHPHLL